MRSKIGQYSDGSAVKPKDEASGENGSHKPMDMIMAEVAINGSSRHMSRACESTGAWFIYSEKSRLVKEPIVVKEGYAYLRDKPGLGVELIESDFNKLAEKFPL